LFSWLLVLSVHLNCYFTFYFQDHAGNCATSVSWCFVCCRTAWMVEDVVLSLVTVSRISWFLCYGRLHFIFNFRYPDHLRVLNSWQTLHSTFIHIYFRSVSGAVVVAVIINSVSVSRLVLQVDSLQLNFYL